MNTAICTLFEGHYHHGVAALSNSLYLNGYRGTMYVGYRGELPIWTKFEKKNRFINCEESKIFNVADGFDLHFICLNTKIHLTNYKADFMLQLWNGPAKNAEGMFYFDPDIVIKCPFSFFEFWIQQGIALVHEISSNDMTANNPIRGMWKTIIEENDEKVIHDLTSYINAGFFGLKKERINFLKTNLKFLQLAKDKYNVNLYDFNMTNRTDPFFAKDQDILNIAAMCTNEILSEIGPEGMDFIYGGFTMSHAIGIPKPWTKSFILSAMRGIPPTKADKEFWKNVGIPINTINSRKKNFKKLGIKIASFIGRFYKIN